MGALTLLVGVSENHPGKVRILIPADDKHFRLNQKWEHLNQEKWEQKNYCLWKKCCCTVRIEFQAFAALVLNSVTDSIVRLRVLKFSAACIYRVDC